MVPRDRVRPHPTGFPSKGTNLTFPHPSFLSRRIPSTINLEGNSLSRTDHSDLLVHDGPREFFSHAPRTHKSCLFSYFHKEDPDYLFPCSTTDDTPLPRNEGSTDFVTVVSSLTVTCTDPCGGGGGGGRLRFRDLSPHVVTETRVVSRRVEV